MARRHPWKAAAFAVSLKIFQSLIGRDQSDPVLLSGDSFNEVESTHGEARLALHVQASRAFLVFTLGDNKRAVGALKSSLKLEGSQ